MSDPKRLVDELRAGTAATRLLMAGTSERPGDEARKRAAHALGIATTVALAAGATSTLSAGTGAAAGTGVAAGAAGGTGAVAGAGGKIVASFFGAKAIFLAAIIGAVTVGAVVALDTIGARSSSTAPTSTPSGNAVGSLAHATFAPSPVGSAATEGSSDAPSPFAGFAPASASSVALSTPRASAEAPLEATPRTTTGSPTAIAAYAPPSPQNASEPTSATTPSDPLLAASAKPSEVTAELRLLDEARGHLRAGNATASLEALSRYDASHPKGALALEARVLRAEALVRAGRTEEGQKVARRILDESPKGPHTARLERLLAGP
jgi:hypothetical protein